MSILRIKKTIKKNESKKMAINWYFTFLTFYLILIIKNNILFYLFMYLLWILLIIIYFHIIMSLKCYILEIKEKIYIYPILYKN